MVGLKGWSRKAEEVYSGDGGPPSATLLAYPCFYSPARISLTREPGPRTRELLARKRGGKLESKKDRKKAMRDYGRGREERREQENRGERMENSQSLCIDRKETRE